MIRILQFLRLANARGQLSLTNLALIVCLVKLALEPHIDPVAAATFLTAILAYRHKQGAGDVDAKA